MSEWFSRLFRPRSKVSTRTGPDYLPGDLVEMTVIDRMCKEFDGRQGVVTYGPDGERGWLVCSAPGSLRCVASELTMLIPREER